MLSEGSEAVYFRIEDARRSVEGGKEELAGVRGSLLEALRG